MSGNDTSSIVMAGFSIVLLVVFLVQVIRESVPAIPNRLLPLVALGVSMALVVIRNAAPAAFVSTVAMGIAIGAAATLSVRFVKKPVDGGDTADTVPVVVAPVAAAPVGPPPGLPTPHATTEAAALALAKATLTDIVVNATK